MKKNMSMGPLVAPPAAEYKVIQDYVYYFADKLGEGNFSTVFKGTHQLTGKKVAIKAIQLSTLTNTRLKELLNSETRVLKTVSHPNLISCQEILSSARHCYIITELCNEGDLQKKLKKCGKICESELYGIASQVYQGLRYLAQIKVVHRDIKTSNIFIKDGHYKIADFGFAQTYEDQFQDISVGSPIYMSPEGYISNLYGPKTDVWAFGVLLFELVQGKAPLSHCRTEQELKYHMLQPLDMQSFESQVSVQLKTLILSCLKVEKHERISIFEIERSEWMKRAISYSKKVPRTKDLNIQANVLARNADLTKASAGKSSSKKVPDDFLGPQKIEIAKKKQNNSIIKKSNSKKFFQKHENNPKKDSEYFYEGAKQPLVRNKKNVCFQEETNAEINQKLEQTKCTQKDQMTLKDPQPSTKQNAGSIEIKREIRRCNTLKGFLNPAVSDYQYKRNMKASYDPAYNKLQRQLQQTSSPKHDNIRQQNRHKSIHKPNKLAGHQLKNQGTLITRQISYSDGLAVIHYCRLCYKLACLLTENCESEKVVSFLVMWAVQLLEELQQKCAQAQVINNQSNLMANPSIYAEYDAQMANKSSKLGNVVNDYIQKYKLMLKSSEKKCTLSGASSFIYDLYLSKGKQYKQLANNIKSKAHMILLNYLSVLDRQTRNLMEFLYEIKQNLDNRQLQSFLSIKVSLCSNGAGR